MVAHALSIRLPAAWLYTLADALTPPSFCPLQVDMLLVGYDEGVGPSFYFLDYLASMQKLDYGSHGYGGFFCNRCVFAYPENPQLFSARSCLTLVNLLSACCSYCQSAGHALACGFE